METIKVNVCIIGAGTAGIAAAYALTKKYGNNKDNKVILVEKQSTLGGTATNAWVQTWIEGINPPYLEDLMSRYTYSKETIKASTLPKKYNANFGFISKLDAAAMSKWYYEDLSTDINIYNGYNFLKVETISEGNIQSVIIENIYSHEKILIHADFFIDSSADGVLCRAAGAYYYVGEDPYCRFQEDLMPKNNKYDNRSLNEPSLFYKISSNECSNECCNDSCCLNMVSTVYEDENKNIIKPDYIGPYGYINELFCNPMTGLGYTGAEYVDYMEQENTYSKEEEPYKVCEKRFLEHWKFVKLTLRQIFNKNKDENEYYWGYIVKQRNWNYTGKYAPMLGVRESFRIKCEYMLRQSDLLKKINHEKLEDFVACGSHEVDLHQYGTIKFEDVKKFNDKIVPSGIPLRCMIPTGLKNTLIACRAYGASHIALSARRVNKDMAQLGWAAGHATVLCLAEKKSAYEQLYQGEDDNHSSPLIRKLQEQSGFRERIEELCKYI